MAIVNIMNVMQKVDESLLDFMPLFNSESTRLNILFDELIMYVFQNGLNIGPLYIELCQFPSKQYKNVENCTYICRGG